MHVNTRSVRRVDDLKDLQLLMHYWRKYYQCIPSMQCISLSTVVLSIIIGAAMVSPHYNSTFGKSKFQFQYAINVI